MQSNFLSLRLCREITAVKPFHHPTYLWRFPSTAHPNILIYRKKQAQKKEREDGFDLDFGVRAKVPEYNALRDVNMRHYFENESVQEHLLQTGQVCAQSSFWDFRRSRSFFAPSNNITNAFRLMCLRLTSLAG